MSSQGTTCALFAIYTTLVTLGSWFHIAAFFFFLLYLAIAHHQIRVAGKAGRGEKKARGQGVWKKKRIKKKRDAVSNSINLQARKPKNIVMLLEIPINSPWR